MVNLGTVLSIVLSKIPSRKILNNEIQFDNITRDTFVRLAGYYVKNYSNDELENLFHYIRNEYEEQADYFRGYVKKGDGRERREYWEHSFNIFDAILIFAVRVLQEIDGEPVCQYEHMLRWRMTSHELDEDVFTTAFLAFNDIRYINDKRDFAWRPVIRHNNVYLNRVLSQGMADNHFHLKGSAPQFPLSWISMMNDVTSRKFRNLLETYSKERLSTNYFTGSEEEHLYIAYLKAALIRCYLFGKILGESLFFAKVEEEIVLEQEDASLEYWKIDQNIREKRTDHFVEYLLQDRDQILFFRDEIQNNISFFRRMGYAKKGQLDYALNGKFNNNISNDPNYILSGERWFMYAMFQKIFSKDVAFKGYFNMFYAYLVIKETIRSELVQTNSNIGFDNFERYQDRKEDFIENTPFEKNYVEMAVKGTLMNQNVIHLEARITPRKNALENRNYIRKFDNLLRDNEVLKQRYFYVFHFIKEKEDPRWIGSNIICRHYLKRKKLCQQAHAIADFREKYPKEARRLRGIDACSKEIGCRPEVFAQTYRYLRNHIVYSRANNAIAEMQNYKHVELEQLSMTYHIGEDYLDVIDGLRAIDEAIQFLRLDCGSRMGHALVLGVDVEEYYQVKNNRILINQQDYLDNLVWLYYKVKKFGLQGYDDLLLFIEQEYSKYFRNIYGNYICDGFFHATMEAAKQYFRQNNESIVEGYCNSNFYFRISEYYASWKLRGDNPECYIDGYYKEPEDISEWNRYAINRNYPADYKVRYNPECAYLYYLYHYCAEAKVEGSKVIEIKVSHQLIQCAKEVQREMRQWISVLGIGIEANPSSNYLIGSFKRYDKHPIFAFYNLGLSSSWEEINGCPQLPVCVNTDDQGIFATYLENEYALLALALEKAKDENGRKKYNRTMIYQWIDNVRKMGINLSFAEQNSRMLVEYKENDQGGYQWGF